MNGALSHIRVLDLSRILAGPWASQTLGDLGAEIIKIERPGVGDDTRQWGPPYIRDEKGELTTDAAYFISANRNKKSVTIDFTKIEGQELIHQLVKHCDVVIENFKVGGLAKYHLDYESLQSINPGLVCCSITGFGQTGPYANRAGYDFLIQGMGGLMSVTGTPESPVKVGVALTDILTGLYAANAIQGALIHKAQTGEGQHIDMSLMDVQVATLANQAMNYLAEGTVPERLGNSHPNIVPYQSFATKDGHLILAVGNDSQFCKFCDVAGRSDLGKDDRFTTNAKRVENRKQLVPLLEEIFAEETLDWWVSELEKAQVPCGPINTLDRVFEDPQVQHREMKIDLPHAAAGTVPNVAAPMKLSKTPVTYRYAPPLLGEHTSEVLEQLLEKSNQDIEALRQEGII